MSAEALIEAAQELSRKVSTLEFGDKVAYVYNPLEYAWEAHAQYLRKYGNGRKKIVFLGMNPGPFGMAQVGVPFGEIELVRDWLQINAPIGKPPCEHPKRPIDGFDCPRSEVSGRRLWGYFKECFGTAEVFFKDHFVANFCPLVFMTETSSNVTPDKLPEAPRKELDAYCQEHLRRVVEILEPQMVIGVGKYAQDQAKAALVGMDVATERILHPSPASPVANQAPGWAAKAVAQLQALGLPQFKPPAA